MTTVRLMLAGGTGRLVRRPSVVLFDPSGQNQDLAHRFDAAASDSDAVDELKKYLIESGFTAAPLVVAEWARSEFNLLVFGDVEVHTSAIAAPMVSGAGSSTWVERHLGAIELGSTTKVEVWSGTAADPTTNLGLGVVACAGFRMSLDLADLGTPARTESVDGLTVRADPPGRPSGSIADPTVATTAAPMVADVAPTVAPAAPPAPPVPEPIAEVVPDPAFAVDPAPAAVVAPIAAPLPGDAVDDWTETEDDEPEAAVDGTDPFTERNDTTPPTPEAPAAAAVAEPFQPDESLTEGAPSAAGADPFGSQSAPSDEPPRAGLIEAAHCPQGHANPPRSSACYVCAESLLEDQSLGLIEQPTVGRIVFTGGQELALERAVMMGRKPEAAEIDAHPVLIDHVEVSRSHAVVSIEGWTVLVTDQGSRNGTWVTPASDPTPVRLDERVPHVLEHGTRVHLGAPEVQFTYYFDAP